MSCAIKEDNTGSKGRETGASCMVERICPVTDPAQESAGYDYILAYMISEICLCRGEKADQIQWDECYEARCFSEKGELHLLKDVEPEEEEPEDENRWRGIRMTDTEDGNENDTIISVYVLTGKFSEGIRKDKNAVLKVKQYYRADEDGQMNVWLTRLAGFEQEGREKDGV